MYSFGTVAMPMNLRVPEDIDRRLEQLAAGGTSKSHLRDPGLLASALARPATRVMRPGPGAPKTALLQSVGRFHPLVDSNKLVAVVVGILICGSKNSHTVRYSLGRATSPMTVASYTYDALPAAVRQDLPIPTGSRPRWTGVTRTLASACSQAISLSRRKVKGPHHLADTEDIRQLICAFSNVHQLCSEG